MEVRAVLAEQGGHAAHVLQAQLAHPVARQLGGGVDAVEHIAHFVQHVGGDPPSCFPQPFHRTGGAGIMGLLDPGGTRCGGFSDG
jgi:hypothetical protein